MVLSIIKSGQVLLKNKSGGTIMKTKNIVSSIIITSLISALFLGCSVLNESTKAFQDRYGQSKYYNKNFGRTMDQISGFKRYPGKVAIYNRTNEPVKAMLLGTIATGGVIVEEFYIHTSGAGMYIEGTNTGKNYGKYEAGPTRNGIIIVVTNNGIEYR